MPEDPLLTMVEVGISFRGTDGVIPLVEHLDLQISAGELVCVAGRSGSGKTSLMRVAAALAEPTSGTVRWNSVDLRSIGNADLARRRREFCAVVEQVPTLLEELTALENVLVPAIPAGGVRRFVPRARQLLAEVGLAARSDHRPRKLSVGERQRVAVARALLLEPKLLVVDEPTSSLDRRTAANIIEVLSAVTSSGAGVLAATHDEGLMAAAVRVIALESPSDEQCGASSSV